MLEAKLIDIEPTTGIRERAFSNKFRRLLWRAHVNHIELFADHVILFAFLRGLKVGALVRAVYFDESVIEMRLCLVLVDVFLQCRNIGRDAKKNASRIEEIDTNIFKRAGTIPMVAGEVERLLRRASTFNWHRRLGKNSAPLL